MSLTKVTYSMINGSIVYVEDFGAVGNGVVDDTLAIQAAIDAAPDGAEIKFTAGAIYKVTKNVGFLPLVYAADDQPCLAIYDRSRLTLNGQGATLRVEVHGQGVLDILQSNWITVQNLTIEGAAEFPPLDGTTGRGEKGTPTEGYYNAGANVSGNPRNNSQNTSAFNTGGYGGAFPQYSGSTAATWGVWKGGYITNDGAGITVDDGATNVVIQNNEIFGFNGYGVVISSNITQTYGWAAPNKVYVLNNYIHDNYAGGVLYHNAIEIFVNKNVIDDNGHPDASVTDLQIDPGYGVASNNGTPPVKVIITDNVFNGNKRKSIDAHAASFMTVSNNIVRNSGGGIVLLTLDYNMNHLAVCNNIVSNIQYTPSAQGYGICITGSSLNSVDFTGNATVSGNIVSEVGAPSAQIGDYPLISDTGLGIIIAGMMKGVSVTGNVVQNIDYFGYLGICMGYAGTDTTIGVVSGNYVKGKWVSGVWDTAANNQQNLVASNNVFLDTILPTYADDQYGINGAIDRTVIGNNVTVPSGQYFVQSSSANFTLIVNVAIVAGVITYTTGVNQSKYVVSVVSSANGFTINLRNGTSVQSASITQYSSAKAVVTSGGAVIDYIYLRTFSNLFEIGLQAAGVDKPATDVTGYFSVAISA
jgi:hypothetical protein